jgi:hypothetical protein
VTFRVALDVPTGATVQFVQVSYSVRGGVGLVALQPVGSNVWQGTIPLHSQNFGKITPATDRPFRFELQAGQRRGPGPGVESHRPHQVVDHDQIDTGIDQLAWLDLTFATVRRNDLLRDRAAHRSVPFGVGLGRMPLYTLASAWATAT